MKNLVIFDTAVGSTNLGDDIILDSIYENMDYLFSNNFALRFGTHITNFTFAQMLRNNGKVKYCKDADLKFICGTNLLSQKMLGMVNAQWQLHLSSIPIYKGCVMIGVGATDGGEKVDIYAQRLYKSVLSKQYVHSVRDEQSRKIVESLGLKAINTGCPTLWQLTPEHCEGISVKKAENAIFTVSGYEAQRDSEIDAQMISILERQYKKLWCWIQTSQDRDYLYELVGENTKINCIYSLSEFRKILREENVDYIGTRLHGGVFALQNSVRSLVISIDHRARGFHEKNNLPIMERKDVPNKLESWINADNKTKIWIDEKAIGEFKAQFA